MYLPQVERNPDPKGDYASLIEMLRGMGAEVPQIMHLFAFKPAATQHLRSLTQEVMRGPSPLTPKFRELIAAFVSTRNQCKFCSGSHIAVAAKLYEDDDLVDAVVKDFRSAPITDAEKLLLAYLEKLTLAPSTTQAEDVDALRDAGWTDEAIYDAVTVCAMFNFYNRWIDGSGVQDMSAEGYARSANRLATAGYAGSTAKAGSNGQ
ncbi:MAG: peroxidase-related enzyme [Acidobacteria bacterium]|nr:peroxidase-related enzyme [Acidobacteriota bacterium]